VALGSFLFPFNVTGTELLPIGFRQEQPGGHHQSCSQRTPVDSERALDDKRSGNFVFLKAAASRPYVDPFLMAALLPIEGKAILHPQFQFQWPCNIHQRTQLNVWQPNSMSLLSVSAVDLRIMIGSAHSVDFLSVLNFSTAHKTHPKDRFRHPTHKTVSAFFPASCPAIRN
jgi:hypothetical protein